LPPERFREVETMWERPAPRCKVPEERVRLVKLSSFSKAQVPVPAFVNAAETKAPEMEPPCVPAKVRGYPPEIAPVWVRVIEPDSPTMLEPPPRVSGPPKAAGEAAELISAPMPLGPMPFRVNGSRAE
jgi:hypothetical protein